MPAVTPRSVLAIFFVPLRLSFFCFADNQYCIPYFNGNFLTRIISFYQCIYIRSETDRQSEQQKFPIHSASSAQNPITHSLSHFLTAPPPTTSTGKEKEWLPARYKHYQNHSSSPFPSRHFLDIFFLNFFWQSNNAAPHPDHPRPCSETLPLLFHSIPTNTLTPRPHWPAILPSFAERSTLNLAEWCP